MRRIWKLRSLTQAWARVILLISFIATMDTLISLKSLLILLKTQMWNKLIFKRTFKAKNISKISLKINKLIRNRPLLLLAHLRKEIYQIKGERCRKFLKKGIPKLLNRETIKKSWLKRVIDLRTNHLTQLLQPAQRSLLSVDKSFLPNKICFLTINLNRYQVKILYDSLHKAPKITQLKPQFSHLDKMAKMSNSQWKRS